MVIVPRNEIEDWRVIDAMLLRNLASPGSASARPFTVEISGISSVLTSFLLMSLVVVQILPCTAIDLEKELQANRTVDIRSLCAGLFGLGLYEHVVIPFREEFMTRSGVVARLHFDELEGVLLDFAEHTLWNIEMVG